MLLDIFSPTGWCIVCNTGSAVWSDTRQQTSLCETCSQREGGRGLRIPVGEGWYSIRPGL
ncbi:MAG: hypothetical protein V1862_08270 [Methanobacteriota archaeon]